MVVRNNRPKKTSASSYLWRHRRISKNMNVSMFFMFFFLNESKAPRIDSKSPDRSKPPRHFLLKRSQSPLFFQLPLSSQHSWKQKSVVSSVSLHFSTCFFYLHSIGIIGYCICSILPAQFVCTHSNYSHPFADLPIFNVSFLPPWTCLNESLHTSQEFGWASMCSRPFRSISICFAFPILACSRQLQLVLPSFSLEALPHHTSTLLHRSCSIWGFTLGSQNAT